MPEFVIGLGTKRLVKKELIDSWQQIAVKARHRLQKDSFLFPVGSSSFVPIAKLPMLEEELSKLKTEFERAVEYLWTNYDTIRAAMLEEFPDYRDSLARLYPPRDVARARFYFVWDVFNVSLPRKAQLVAFDKQKRAESEWVLASYRSRLEQRMGEFLADVVTTMRTKITTTCIKIADRVRKGEVEDMLTKLEKEVLAGRDADAFEKDKKLMTALTTTLDAIQKTAEAVTDVSEITGGYKRRIRM